MKNIETLAQEHLDYARNLSYENKVIVWLRDNTPDYQAPTKEERWKIMENDLRDRKEKRPYIYKIINRIVEDLPKLRTLKAYESEHKIDLADYIDHVEKQDHPQ